MYYLAVDILDEIEAVENCLNRVMFSEPNLKLKVYFILAGDHTIGYFFFGYEL